MPPGPYRSDHASKLRTDRRLPGLSSVPLPQLDSSREHPRGGHTSTPSSLTPPQDLGAGGRRPPEFWVLAAARPPPRRAAPLPGRAPLSSAARPPPRSAAPLLGAPSRQRAPSVSARGLRPPAPRPRSANAGSARPAAPGAVCQPAAKVNSAKSLPSPRGPLSQRQPAPVAAGSGFFWAGTVQPHWPARKEPDSGLEARRPSHLPSNAHRRMKAGPDLC